MQSEILGGDGNSTTDWVNGVSSELSPRHMPACPTGRIRRELVDHTTSVLTFYFTWPRLSLLEAILILRSCIVNLFIMVCMGVKCCNWSALLPNLRLAAVLVYQSLYTISPSEMPSLHRSILVLECPQWLCRDGRNIKFVCIFVDIFLLHLLCRRLLAIVRPVSSSLISPSLPL